eukprot:TRINITY_DN1521_c0_g3_i1.p2 TRINITY_DN1521_c0_g3~~TRINITY_DN1521_c0_g3_i1.p2  ORF type:complete len:122 (+),score=24.76 TRINITY_DN1521_c0_g3_i1:19-384(+)
MGKQWYQRRVRGGKFEVFSLKSLIRSAGSASTEVKRPCKFTFVIGPFNIGANQANVKTTTKALFQVPLNFNCTEGPDVGNAPTVVKTFTQDYCKYSQSPLLGVTFFKKQTNKPTQRHRNSA